MNGETGLVKLRFQKFGALVFLVADFGELPDLARYVAVVGGASVHLFEQGFFVRGKERCSADENDGDCSHLGHDSLVEAPASNSKRLLARAARKPSPAQVIGSGLRDDSFTDGVENHFGDAVEIQLLQDMRAVGVYCIQAESQCVGDFLVGFSLSH